MAYTPHHVQGPRYAIFLTLLVAALAGQRALVWTTNGHPALPSYWEQPKLTVLARRVAWRLSRARQSRAVSPLSLVQRVSAHRLVHAVQQLLSAHFIPARLSPLTLRLPPPADA